MKTIYTRQMTETDKASARSTNIGCLAIAAIVGIGGAILGYRMYTNADDMLGKLTGAIIGINCLIILGNWLLRPLLSGGTMPGMPGAEGMTTVEVTQYGITFNNVLKPWRDLNRAVIQNGNLILYEENRPKLPALTVLKIHEYENSEELLATVTEKVGEIEH